MANHRRIDPQKRFVGVRDSLERCTGIPVIKRIELINFMSHRHTVIELDAGLTVLVGPNNCGKSAIVTALQILCHNDNSTYVLRHGAKECRIIAETEEGHRIEWIRKKNGSPCYLIDGKEFDRLRGDSGVWQELKQTLRMPRLEFDNNNKFDVHIGEQRNPIFLLGDKGKGAAQFFASSSDAIRLVEMQALHKKQISENKSERKFLIQQQTEANAAVETLATVPAIAESLVDYESQYDALKTEQQAVEDLSTTISELKQKRKSVAHLTAIESTLNKLPELPTFENVEALRRSTNQLRKQRQQIQHNEATLATLKTLPAPPTVGDVSSLANMLKSLRTQQRATDRLSRSMEVLARVTEPPQATDEASVTGLAKFLVQYQTELESHTELKKQHATANRNVIKVAAEINQWAQENPNCPTCGSQVSADALISDGGHRHG